MRFYTQQHRHDCGLDLPARSFPAKCSQPSATRFSRFSGTGFLGRRSGGFQVEPLGTVKGSGLPAKSFASSPSLLKWFSCNELRRTAPVDDLRAVQIF